MAANDLTTLLKVKDWLGLKGAEHDDILRRMITAISTAAEVYCCRKLKSGSQVEVRNGHGGVKIMLENFPVTAVSSVVVDGVTIPSSSYTFTATSIILTSGSFTRGNGNITISYTGGYVDVPYDLEQAIIEWIELRFKRMRSVDMVSKGLAGETTTYSQADIPAFAKTVLGNYRRMPL